MNNYRIIDYKPICSRLGLEDTQEFFDKTLKSYLDKGWETIGEVHLCASGHFMCQDIILKEVIDTKQ